MSATGGILLAKSPEQNHCGKICSHHGAKLDENRTSTLTNSTIIQSIGHVCRLIVISPTVSDFLVDTRDVGRDVRSRVTLSRCCGPPHRTRQGAMWARCASPLPNEAFSPAIS